MSNSSDHLHMRGPLDSTFSFRADKEFVFEEPDSINQAVSKEDWYKVSLR